MGRILVVDDQPAIHHDFERVLAAGPSAAFDVLEAELFARPAQPAPPRYLLASADQGVQAVAMVRAALDRGEPFDLAFVDARMPPGIDGIETVRRLWEHDATLHVVLCTAFADYQWEDIERAIGITDRFLILKKPFDPLEVRQLAAALTHKAHLVRAQREAMSRAQALQALGRLTAGIAHEINNPLQVVRGSLELLDDELDRRGLDDLLRRLRPAIANTDRIAAIVAEIRMFAAPQEVLGQPVAVDKVLAGALTLLGRATPPRVAITQTVEAVGPVLASEHRLAQVFVNLLENALAALGDRDEPRIAIRIADGGAGEVLVEIADNGEGIHPADLARVFEPFFTTREVGRGTGLGLSISKGIVEGFGGRIEIASERGRGTTVRVRLQRAVPSTIAAPDVPVVIPDGLAILVVDDEEQIRQLVGAMLVRHRPVACASAREALALAAGTAFDVILCDVAMPERSGLELVDDLRALSPTLAARVILMSGAADPMAAWPGDRLDKPFSRRQLEAAIGRVLERAR